MEIMRGKRPSRLSAEALAETTAGYEAVHIDLGTGDGRYPATVARACRTAFAIGVDACRENLHDASRRAPENALYVIANAQALPPELDGLADQITINFPWGSLIEGLLAGDAALLEGLRRIARRGAGLELRLNGGALAEAGWTLEAGACRARETLAENGFEMLPPLTLTTQALRDFPTTWAKRLAYGRDPRAVWLHGGMRKERAFPKG